jgi:hypothetical protein
VSIFDLFIYFLVRSYFLDLTNIVLDCGTLKLFWIPRLSKCLFSERNNRDLNVKLKLFIYYVI